MPTLELNGKLFAEQSGTGSVKLKIDELTESTANAGIRLAHPLKSSAGDDIMTADGALHNINFDNVANNVISGDKIHGGTISGFSSVGIQDNANSVAITIDSDGNVGIGPVTPSTNLHLFAQTGDVGINVQSSVTANAKAFIQLYGRDASNVNKTWKIENDAHDLAFSNEGTPRIRINSSGNVGIEEITPSDKLHIKKSVGSIYEGGLIDGGIRIDTGYASGNGAYGHNGITFYGDADNASFIYQIHDNNSSSQLVIGTNNTERIRINSSGRVGIGTDSPTRDLHVNGSFYAGATGSTAWGVYKYTNVSIGDFASGASPTNAWNSDELTWKFTNYNNCLTIAVGGTINNRQANIQVGHSSVGSYSQYYGSLYLNKLGGSVYANSTSISDIRKKENFEPIVDAVSKIKKLNGYTFNMIEVEPEKRQAGLIAQDVIEVLPEAVTYEESEDFYGVSYHMLSALYVEAIKELKAELETVKAELQTLRGN